MILSWKLLAEKPKLSQVHQAVILFVTAALCSKQDPIHTN
jgi:hypothetical protein